MDEEVEKKDMSDMQIIPMRDNRRKRRRNGENIPSDNFLYLQGKQMIEQAEQKVDKLQDTDIWTQWKTFYAIAESKWKTLDTEFINTPGHTCQRNKCTMRHERVVIHREDDKTTTDLMSVMMGNQLLSKNLHVCFPRYCEHFGAHACDNTSICPHRRLSREEDMKELRFVWICTETGSFHICGPYCMQKSIRTDKEGHMICPLTGIIVDTTYGTVFPEDNSFLPGFYTGLLTSKEYEMRVQKKVSRGPRILLPWQRSDDMLQYRALTNILLDALLFSEQRQNFEVSRIVDACNKAHNETARALRPKKGKDDRLYEQTYPEYGNFYRHTPYPQNTSAISITYAMSVLATYYPTTKYFHIVPPKPTVFPLIKNAIKTTPILNQHIPHIHEEPVTPTKECPHCRREKCQSRLREVLHELSSDVVSEEPMRWESEKWQKFMTSTKKMITDIAIRIWINLNKHSYDPNKGREDMSYTKIILAIIYLMKSEYSIPVQTQTNDNTNMRSVPRVVVIPRLSIASMLPSDAILPKLDLPKTCRALVRTLNITQSHIKDRFSELVRKGHGYDIQISLGMASLAETERVG